MDKLSTSSVNNDTVVNLIHSLGQLASVGGPDFVKQKDEIFSLLLQHIQDTYSSSKKEVDNLKKISFIC